MELDNPMVWVWSGVMYAIVLVAIWKFGGGGTGGFKWFFTIAAAPCIFFVTAIMADR